MRLSELLEELRRNILRDTSTAVTPAHGGDERQLWSDSALIRYINDSYFKFARRTMCIRDDSTPAVCTVHLREGVNRYKLHTATLAVYAAALPNGIVLTREHSNSAVFAPANVARASYGRTLWRGGPAVYTTDSAVRTLVLQGMPSQELDGQVLQLRVARLPLTQLGGPNDEPEIDECYHLDLLEWAAYLALRNHDVDAENLVKASSHRRRFDEVVEEAVVTVRRREFEPLKFEPNTDWR